jgi:hypothetical protein
MKAGKFFIHFYLYIHKRFVDTSSVVSVYSYLCNYFKVINNGPRKTDTCRGLTINN